MYLQAKAPEIFVIAQKTNSTDDLRASLARLANDMMFEAFEFHPWEKNISNAAKTHLSEDVPILDYLSKLDAIGENIYDYGTIWYYY